MTVFVAMAKTLMIEVMTGQVQKGRGVVWWWCTWRREGESRLEISSHAPHRLSTAASHLPPDARASPLTRAHAHTRPRGLWSVSRPRPRSRGMGYGCEGGFRRRRGRLGGCFWDANMLRSRSPSLSFSLFFYCVFSFFSYFLSPWTCPLYLTSLSFSFSFVFVFLFTSFLSFFLFQPLSTILSLLTYDFFLFLSTSFLPFFALRFPILFVTLFIPFVLALLTVILS